MPEPRERIYDLALRALDEQERQVGDLRSRLAPVVAAAGVAVTILTRPAFQGPHPTGWIEITGTAVGLAGAGVVVLATVYLLISRPLAFSIDARDALKAAEELDLLEDGTLLMSPWPSGSAIAARATTRSFDASTTLSAQPWLLSWSNSLASALRRR
jgi:hypothetical protein